MNVCSVEFVLLLNFLQQMCREVNCLMLIFASKSKYTPRSLKSKVTGKTRVFLCYSNYSTLVSNSFTETVYSCKPQKSIKPKNSLIFYKNFSYRKFELSPF